MERAAQQQPQQHSHPQTVTPANNLNELGFPNIQGLPTEILADLNAARAKILWAYQLDLPNGWH